MNIIQIYTPTADKNEKEVELLYQNIQEIFCRLPKNNLNIIMGNFNAKLREGVNTSFVGPHGLGERNERGDRLEMFAEENEIVVLNTFFRLPPRRLYTWKSPADKLEQIIRNQIDFMMVNRRFRNSITSVKTYPSADIMSDHTPFVGFIKLRLKKIKRKTKTFFKMTLLKDPSVKQKVGVKINEQINQLKQSNSFQEDVTQFGEMVQNIKKEFLKSNREKKKPWMTDEIVELINERKNIKSK